MVNSILLDNLWLIPLFPLVGFLLVGLFGRRMRSGFMGVLSALSVFASFLTGLAGFILLLKQPEKVHHQILGSWMSVGSLKIEWGFLFDPLSALMVLLVTGVGTLILIYSIGYMKGEGGRRYFAFLNLFCSAMLLLVMGNNALVMFLGWQGVGLCSYLLIGFHFGRKSSAAAAGKAFIFNRVGDAALLLGFLSLFWSLGADQVIWTFNFSEIARKEAFLGIDSAALTFSTFCLFVGAASKSAQFPLHSWLPDAMEGPTPVSAFIHSAAMVAAGAYLILRMEGLFAMAPLTMAVMVATGAATALFAAVSAMAQTDIKSLLAYSTISQLGFIFVALGVGNTGAAIFHLIVLAIFKACLFLGVGSVIAAMLTVFQQQGLSGNPRDLNRMGGLAKKMPVTFILVFLATLMTSAAPLCSGFFSGDGVLQLLGIPLAGFTAFYLFRLLFLCFWGEYRGEGADLIKESSCLLTVPSALLGGGGIFLCAAYFGFPGVVESSLEGTPGRVDFESAGLAAAAIFAGVVGAWVCYGLKPSLPIWFSERYTGLYRVVSKGYYLDAFFQKVIVEPCRAAGTFLWKDLDIFVLDGIINGTAWITGGIGKGFRYSQTGSFSNYALGIVVTVVLIIGFYVLN